jgi:hypothetical protein
LAAYGLLARRQPADIELTNSIARAVRRGSMLATIFVANQACALGCEKIEYIEVKDWKPAVIAKAYCDADKETKRVFEVAGTQNDIRPILKEADICMKQMELYKRALKNLHGRNAPACPPK